MRVILNSIVGLTAVLTIFAVQSCGSNSSEPVIDVKYNTEAISNGISTPRMKTESELGGGSGYNNQVTTWIGGKVKLVSHQYTVLKTGDLTWV